MEEKTENIVGQADVLSEKDLVECVIGIPVNAVLLKVSALTMDENGTITERGGKFDLEQIIAARAKYVQMADLSGRTSGISDDPEEKEETACEEASAVCEEESGEH